ncbi:sulfatase-like hydrolase/transferase [Tichowtungia aerotolerans]|uniref:Sulfatase-like hydrolase/transferase n=1 Tax=Tichowtungia aerotolerans TaxID=2697043 RepID=A0A6P1M584_9BACT|nr:sulfatase-like hydrolase/transferase [Tichowtungia aerotolerans]QHI69212.1 sulfatase-like hydrolase/transferase [Tichowtungia aerotolerans]
MKRRVVVMMTDTQRKDMVSCYGNPEMKTPNLDRLAAEGARFEKAYTCQPVCGPARAALFTGTWPHINNGWSNSMALDARTRTLGPRAQAEGLHTAYIGKWHLDGGDYFGDGICPEGWDPDYWYDMKRYLDELSAEERMASRREETNLIGDGVQEGDTFGHRVADRAVDFLEKHGENDFLLVVSFDEPHDPFLAPQRFIDMHKNTRLPWRKNMTDPLADKPEHQRVWAGSRMEQDREDLDLAYRNFFACNSFADYEIGRVLDAIDQHAPDALVVYTSDHGDMLESHRIINKGPVMYDEITNIPFIVRWPGVIPSGSVSENLISHIDVVPTVLDAIGASEVPKVLHGKSMVPMFGNLSESSSDEIFVEFGRYEIDHDGFGGFQPVRCVRNDRYKLVINLLCTDELYDMQEDPEEMVNLIENPEHVPERDSLHDKLIEWMNETRDPFRGYYWQRRPWRADAPSATWEFTGCTRQREPDTGESRQLDYDTGMPMSEAVRHKRPCF